MAAHTAPQKAGKRLAPALALFLLAPWVGEYLLGNVPITQIGALPVLALLYGGGALLIREFTRRTGRGWPCILLLGVAYGVIEAGLIDQSIFNGTFQSHHAQGPTYLASLRFNLSNAFAYVFGHAIWSIGVSVGLAELLAGKRRLEPWLRKQELYAPAAAYLLGCLLIFRVTYRHEHFLASAGQLAGAAAVAALFVGLALLTPKAAAARGHKKVPSARKVGIISFIASLLFFVKPETWGGLAYAVFLLAGMAWLVRDWAAQQGWSSQHQLFLLGGALLVYGLGGFIITGIVRPHLVLAWVGNGIFWLGALLLLRITGSRIRYNNN